MNDVEILCKLIEIPSQIGIDNEKEISIFLKKMLQKNGFEIEEYEFEKGRPNIIATYSFSRTGPTILFNGHMDTMPFSNGENLWIVPPNKATIIDNKVYGRGACDMKGGIASALAAIFRCIKEDNGCGKIIVNLVSDEENTSLYGTVQLCNNELLNADFAIVMEPTECKVCPQQLGNMFFQTYIRGIGGHTGVPKNKVNPFELAFQYVEKLKEWINTKKQNVEDIQPFINIGHFQGGTASGTIPSECELFWGTRVLPEDNFDDYVLEVNEITKKFQNCIPNDCCIETKLFEGGGIDSFSSRSIYADKLIELAEEKEFDVFPASSDAGFIYNVSKINCVIFGPGSLQQAHMSNEFVKITDLNKCTGILYKFLISVGDINE